MTRKDTRKNAMEKPRADEQGAYHYASVMKYLEKTYRFDSSDFSKSGKHFARWCRKKGYGQRDPEGNSQNCSRIWYDEYCKDPNGQPARPQREDFGDWLRSFPLKASGKAIVSGARFSIDIPYYLERFNDEVGSQLAVQKKELEERYALYVDLVVPADMRHLVPPLPLYATLPDFVRTILSWMRDEFGEQPRLVF